eukprot:211195_1
MFVDYDDFITKVMSNKYIMILLIVDIAVGFCIAYLGTKVQIHVSTVAKRVIKASNALPIWLVGLVIINPKTQKKLESFNPKLWNEWFIILSFMFSTLGIMCYYEIGVPMYCKRTDKKDVNCRPIEGEIVVTTSNSK